MTVIVLVRDVDELGIIQQKLGRRPDDSCVYTLFPLQFLELTREGIQPHILSEHFTAEEAYAIYRRAFEDSIRIADSFPLTRGPLRVNLARFYKVYYWWHLFEVYAFDLALNRMLDQRNGAKLWYVQRTYSSLKNHVQLTDSDFIAGHMLDVLSQQRPLDVQPIGGVPAARGRGTSLTRFPLLGKTGHPLRYLKHITRRLLTRAKAPITSQVPSIPAEPRIIAFGSGYDILTVIPDALWLAAKSDRVPLLMTEGVDKETTRTGLVWKEEYERIERLSINQYLSANPAPSLSSLEKQQADKAFEELVRRLNQIDVIHRYRLTATMSELRHEFRRAFWRAKALDHVLARLAGSAIVVTDFNGLDERFVEQLAQKHNLELHARPHGWLANVETFEFVADHYYCDGRLRAEAVDKVYHYGERIKVHPDLSLLNVSGEWLAKSPTEQQIITAQRRAALSIQAENVILLMTTAARPQILNEFDYARLRDSWNAIFDYLKKHPDICVVVKSHKNNYDPWVEAWAREQGVTNLIILKGRLEDALIIADLVVDFGKPGTATLSALLFERPLLLYRGLYKYVREFGDMVHAAGASFVVETPQALIQEWDTLRREGIAHLIALRARNQALRHLLAEPTKVDNPPS
jgi:hypothetical protein